MARPLRWHERLLIRLLLMSLRVDKVLIVQCGTALPPQCDRFAAQMQLEVRRHNL